MFLRVAESDYPLLICYMCVVVVVVVVVVLLLIVLVLVLVSSW